MSQFHIIVTPVTRCEGLLRNKTNVNNRETGYGTEHVFCVIQYPLFLRHNFWVVINQKIYDRLGCE